MPTFNLCATSNDSPEQMWFHQKPNNNLSNICCMWSHMLRNLANFHKFTYISKSAEEKTKDYNDVEHHHSLSVINRSMEISIALYIIWFVNSATNKQYGKVCQFTDHCTIPDYEISIDFIRYMLPAQFYQENWHETLFSLLFEHKQLIQDYEYELYLISTRSLSFFIHKYVKIMKLIFV